MSVYLSVQGAMLNAHSSSIRRGSCSAAARHAMPSGLYPQRFPAVAHAALPHTPCGVVRSVHVGCPSPAIVRTGAETVRAGRVDQLGPLNAQRP